MTQQPTAERLKKLERVRPEVLQAILMDEIAGRLADLQETIAKTIPQGIHQSLTLTIEDQIQRIKPPTPWFSFSLYNKITSNTVYGWVNDKGGNRHTIEPDDTWNVNMGAAKIESIYLKCDSGESATVLISAVR